MPVFCMVGVALTLILLHTLDVKRSKRRLIYRLAAEIGVPLGALCWLLVAWRPLPGHSLSGLPGWAQGPGAGFAVWVGTAVVLGCLGLFAGWRIKSVFGWRGISAEIGLGIAYVILIVALITIAWGVLFLMAR